MDWNEDSETTVGYRRTVPLDRTTAEDLVALAREVGGLESSAYRTLSEHLWGYAMPVIKDALRTGKMSAMLKERGVYQFISASDRVALHTSLEARDDLAIDVVAAGEVHLKEVTIAKNRWKPDVGASIETFFVTGCLFQFPSVYRRWSKERTDRHATLVGLLPETFAPTASTFDTAETAVNREMALSVLREADDTTRAILALLASDHTYAEVGQIVGLSERAVEGRVYRFKTSIRDTFNERGSSRRKGRAA